MHNWLGLVPEERWWLYTMTNAATGHAVNGRNKGWRKAVRFALTENPVMHGKFVLHPIMSNQQRKNFSSSSGNQKLAAYFELIRVFFVLHRQHLWI